MSVVVSMVTAHPRAVFYPLAIWGIIGAWRLAAVVWGVVV